MNSKIGFIIVLFYLLSTGHCESSGVEDEILPYEIYKQRLLNASYGLVRDTRDVNPQKQLFMSLKTLNETWIRGKRNVSDKPTLDVTHTHSLSIKMTDSKSTHFHPMELAISKTVRHIPRCDEIGIKFDMDTYRRWDCSQCTKSRFALNMMSDELCWDIQEIKPNTCLNSPKQKCPEHLMARMDEFFCQKVDTDFLATELPAKDFITTGMFCNIGTRKIKQCPRSYETIETLYWVLLGKRAFFYDSGIEIFTQEPKAIASYKCTGPCDRNICESRGCSGDQPFCEHIGCTQNSACYCRLRNESKYFDVILNGNKYRPTCWGNSKVVVTKPLMMPVESHGFTCKHCKINCSSHDLEIESKDEQLKHIRICKNPTCMNFKASTNNVKIPLLEEMKTRSGSAIITIWSQKHEEPYQTIVNCPGLKPCELINTFWSLNRFSNWRCFSWFHWLCALVVVSCSIIGALMILKTCFTCLNKFATPALMYCIKRRVVNEQNVEQIPLIEVNNNRNEEAMNNRNRMARALSHKKVVFALVVFFATCINCDCSIANSISAESTQCSRNAAGVETCEFVTNSRIAMAPVGQTSCFILESSLGTRFGSVKLVTKNAVLECKKFPLYYVPFAQANCAAYRNCPTVNNCSQQGCSNFGENDRIERWSFQMEHSGFSQCFSVDGGVFNWCGWFGDSCLWTRKFLTNPTAQYYEVFSCSEFSLKLTTSVKLETINLNKSMDIDLYYGVTKSIGNLDFSLVSISLPPRPELNMCFMTDGKSVAVTTCATKGSTAAGLIGEIQCPSRESAIKLDSRCKMNPNIITMTPHQDEVTCSSFLISPQIIFKQNLLPRNVRDTVLMPSGTGSLFMELNSNVLADVSMSAKQLRVSSLSDKVDCFVTFIELGGCCACSTGAEMVLELNTNAGQAIASIECEELKYQTTILVTDKVYQHKLTFHYDNPSVSAKCQMTCSNQVKFTVSGTLTKLEFEPAQSAVLLVAQDENQSFSMSWPEWLSLGWIKVYLYTWYGCVMGGCLIILLAWCWFQQARMRAVVGHLA